MEGRTCEKQCRDRYGKRLLKPEGRTYTFSARIVRSPKVPIRAETLALAESWHRRCNKGFSLAPILSAILL